MSCGNERNPSENRISEKSHRHCYCKAAAFLELCERHTADSVVESASMQTVYAGVLLLLFYGFHYRNIYAVLTNQKMNERFFS